MHEPAIAEINKVLAAFDRENTGKDVVMQETTAGRVDSNGKTGAQEYYIVFTDKQGTKYLNKYLLRDDSVTMIFHNVPATSNLYKDYEQNRQRDLMSLYNGVKK